MDVRKVKIQTYPFQVKEKGNKKVKKNHQRKME